MHRPKYIKSRMSSSNAADRRPRYVAVDNFLAEVLWDVERGEKVCYNTCATPTCMLNKRPYLLIIKII